MKPIDLTHVSVVTEGKGGSGKTLVRGALFCRDVWLEDHDGVMFTNFPLNLEVFEKYLESKGRSGAEVHRRIKLIPEDVIDAWKNEISGPWEFLGCRPIKGQYDYGKHKESDEDFERREKLWAGYYWPELIRVTDTGKEGIDTIDGYIALDEAHVFCGKGADTKHVSKWMGFLGELRHAGMRGEFITQDMAKIHTKFKDDVGGKLALYNLEQEREPLTGALIGDWYQLWANMVSGKYSSRIIEKEYTKKFGVWICQASRSHGMDDTAYKFYNSYSAPHHGGIGGRSKKEWERMSRPRFLLWFLSRNWYGVAKRLAMVIAFVWFMSGGGSWLFAQFLEHMSIAAKPVKDQEKVKADGNVSESKKADESAEIKELQNQLKKQSELADKVMAENKAIQEKIRQEQLVCMLTQTELIMRNGLSLREGEIIPFGDFKGKRVQRVDFGRRQVVLSGGVVLWFGASGWLCGDTGKTGEQGGTSGISGTAMAGPVQANGAGTGTQGATDLGIASHCNSGSDAVSGVAPVPGR